MRIDPADIPVQALRDAAGRPEVVAAVRDLYARADRQIGEHAPTCWNKGACCRFGEYGHRLYVTALEAVYYLALGTSSADDKPAAVGTTGVALRIASNLQTTADTCPHAHDGRCHARKRRPLGCRVFFCDPAAQHWQGPMTEEFLGVLRSLHERLGVPYFYADWMVVLAALDGDPPTAHEQAE